MESWRRELYHSGRSKLDGAPKGSGRYPLGSGRNPRAFRGVYAVGQKIPSNKVVSDRSNPWFESTIKGGKDKPNKSPAQAIFNESSKMMGDASNIINEGRKMAKKKGDYSKMSDNELRERINRLNLEQQYSRLSNENVSNGFDRAQSALAIIGSVASIAASAAFVYATVQGVKKK